ncbi:MAG: CcmD family protein [Acidobacteriota bacterium]|nr:CcmD family protein [Acidobacteriota bacterium]
MRFSRVLLLLMVLAAAAWPVAVHAMQPPPQSEFLPVSDIPEGEQIPAFTMVGAAYGFVWVVLLGYVWSIARRLQKVEAELAALETRGK